MWIYQCTFKPRTIHSFETEHSILPNTMFACDVWNTCLLQDASLCSKYYRRIHIDNKWIKKQDKTYFLQQNNSGLLMQISKRREVLIMILIMPDFRGCCSGDQCTELCLKASCVDTDGPLKLLLLFLQHLLCSHSAENTCLVVALHWSYSLLRWCICDTYVKDFSLHDRALGQNAKYGKRAFIFKGSVSPLYKKTKHTNQ